MNRKFFIMALIRGVFGYFPCGLGLAIILEAFNRYSLKGFLIGGAFFLIGGLVFYFTRRYESSDRLL
ncbi:hypothetical protein QD47_05470 [Paenibacillus terrae]|uniref:Urease accessory protein UreH-like transmembrane domain-containing protein n=1 Tax=Paenibacillus terrae TaxID=159743 RepID=A0A0D7X6Q3_9BACL|nr:hypothetical protein QD47_05470 [Paenibacillus terrae]